MKSKQEILDLLSQYTGTSAYHRFSTLPGFLVATDGVIALVEAAECYWLLNVIGLLQINPSLDPDFQVWKLEVNTEKHSTILRGYNDTELIVEEHIPFTDFPYENNRHVLGKAEIIQHLGDNLYLAEYNGIRCTAIFNPFAGRYFVDDVYGIQKEVNHA